MMKVWGFLSVALAFLVFTVSPMRAQEVAGVTGVVLDKSGAAIGGAQVALDSSKTGFHQETTTNDQGSYQFLRVPPGSGYKLTFTKTGFRKLELNDVALGVETISTRNATLEVGETSQTVEVTAAAAETLNTTDASIGNVLDVRTLRDLPSLIRETPASLLGLQAGVVANSGGGTNQEGSVTGARTDQSNVTVDGIDVNDQAGGFAFATVGNAPIDSVQEFRATTADAEAYDGRSAGAQIQLVTKSGTDSFHGAAYEYNRTAATAANDFFNNSSGVARPALTRNQFGGDLGGPIKKDRLFFFFNYEGRRDASQSAQARTVPLANVRAGGINYVNGNNNDSQGNPCSDSARLNDPVTAQCITQLTPAQLATFDPQGIGDDPAELAILTKVPAANDLTGGDGVNTGFYRFNAPVKVDHNTYVGRVDYTISSNQKLFSRFNVLRESDTQAVQQFPGDPTAQLFQDKSWAFVIGHTWTINSHNINAATFGITQQYNNFPAGPGAFPTFPNEFTFGPFSTPFAAGVSSQGRTVPVPTIRDDYTWIHEKHTIQFGTNIRPIREKSTLTNSFNFLGVGLGEALPSLGPSGSPLRPSDILETQAQMNEWDSTFTALLGHYASESTNFIYNKALQPQPAGATAARDFHYNETELYFADNWRVRNDLTISYGVRWSFDSVPFESNGFETVPNVSLNTLFSVRQYNGLLGISGNDAAPNLTYSLGGPANNGQGYYKPDYKDFGPRLGIAWNPSFKDGLLGSLFGDRKTTVRAGGSIVFDRIAGAVSFLADQNSFLFQNSNSVIFGDPNPVTALMNDPRFTSLTALPAPVVAPIVTSPTTPFVNNGVPFGTSEDNLIYAVDPNFKTPYEDTFGLGIQRELPGNVLLEVNYVGRLGRRLFAQSDGAQLTDFTDPSSQQGLIAAFNNIAKQVRANVPINNITPQPFFENQLAASPDFGGTPCSVIFPGSSCTQALAGSTFSQFFLNGDITDFLVGLDQQGLIQPNIGIAAQAASIAYVTSNSSSNYNGLLTTLSKKFSNGLQLNVNYTFSHSIDNLSSVVNTSIGGIVCDLRNLRVCRGSSDFDARHIVSSYWVYDLPVGRKGYIGRNMPGWADRVVGGWEVSGIWTWRTGFPFSTATSSFPVSNYFGGGGFVGSPGVLTGSLTGLGSRIHNENGTLQYFADPTTTIGEFANPLGGQTGNRNDILGPSFWTIDAALLKNIKLTERLNLQFRAEAFNLFNHENFAPPSTNINSPSTFGALTGTVGEGPRQMQIALRLEF
ncbi:MAG TPA: carboxypeptidase-like regulatory domain-containing protein [Candidatus Acidoferrum sp.]|nr:carboxypeptidase-like regulatory domain-containing protein [Candidatus Acidoferrum sp.]